MNTETANEHEDMVYQCLEALVEKQGQLEVGFSQLQEKLEKRIEELENQLLENQLNEMTARYKPGETYAELGESDESTGAQDESLEAQAESGEEHESDESNVTHEEKLGGINYTLSDLMNDDSESLEADDAMLQSQSEELQSEEGADSDVGENTETITAPIAKDEEAAGSDDGDADSDKEIQRLRSELNEKLREAELELAISRATVSQREAELEERLSQIDRRESALLKTVKYDNSKESVLARLKQYLK